jgi:hypothetical protein
MSDSEDARQRVEDELGHGVYGPGALDEVTVPRADPVRETKDRDLHDPAHVDVDPEEWRNGGPTRTPGVMTTTGGTAGPASVNPRPPRNEGPNVAPTTTGDATTGGMDTPVGGTTSDASSGSARIGNFADEG